MSSDLRARLDRAQDDTHAIVTCLLTGQRSEAGAIFDNLDDTQTLSVALVACDLAAFIHHRWCDVLAMDDETRLESWRELLLEVAEWRQR